ncbi:MAG: 50S ribosomal protein L11 methyltransferase [Clostridiales bacterium]|jgi:ribosomal protein L11 methyltransferase|nr:50S ribosomal protein L11 methyltransferase [Clostridiales bacterium]
MRWIETTLYTTSEGMEAVFAALMDAGIEGAQIHDDADMKRFIRDNPDSWDYVDDELLNAESGEPFIRFYINDDESGAVIIRGVKAAIKTLRETRAADDMGSLRVETRRKDDSDWIDEWKKFYKPFKVGEKVVVKPVWEEYERKDDETVFTIEPGRAFGTGLHQSTRLCIMELEKRVTPGAIALDIGCGSGILSVIAVLLGVERAAAVDIDRNAADITRKNASLNGVSPEKLTVYTGDALNDESLRGELLEQTYDIVVANIVADVVIALAVFARTALKRGGAFISSGIIAERLNDVLEALEREGFLIDSTCEKDGWACVTALR